MPFLRRVVEAFESKFVKGGPSDCWEWIGGSWGGGYGYFRQRKCYAHRFSWILYRGQIPEGLWVLHRCDNRPCVNPSHLFLGTRQDNIDDMRSKGREACRKGTANGRARLTEKDVLDIRARFYSRYVKGKMGRVSNLHQIAAEKGVAAITVQKVVSGETWKHLL